MIIKSFPHSPEIQNHWMQFDISRNPFLEGMEVRSLIFAEDLVGYFKSHYQGRENL